MSDKIMYTESGGFESAVLKSTIPVIVDFFSDECPPCEVLAPIFEKMAEKYGEHIKFVKIKREENKDFAKSLHVSGSPTVLFFKDGKEIGSRLAGFMSKPQVRRAIEDILGGVIPKEPMQRVDCDVLILGAGAAGLSAAIYAARAKMNTVLVDESVPGGQTASTYHVANYPGTPGVVRGREIIDNMREQALSFGARIDDLKEIAKVDLTGKTKYVLTEDTAYYAKSVIIASGAKPRALPALGADEFKGRGVHYCATCDGSMYQDRCIVVVGGGNSAVEEAVFLSKYAKELTLIHQFDNFQASQTAQEALMNNPKIRVIWDSEIRKVMGEGHALNSVEIENIKTKECSIVSTEGAFVYIGTQPMSEWFAGQVEMDETGYIKASEDTQTNVEGVFAAGDIRTKPIRQVVTAAADGAVAGIMAERYVAGL
jgi:thioredoxin reductase (NADPH)